MTFIYSKGIYDSNTRVCDVTPDTINVISKIRC